MFYNFFIKFRPTETGVGGRVGGLKPPSTSPPHPPEILANFYFLWTEKKIVLKWKIVKNCKTHWNSSKFIDFYNIIIELNTRGGIYPVSNKLREIFFLFNRSLKIALHRTPLLLFSVETKKKSFRRIFRLSINLLPKTSLL